MGQLAISRGCRCPCCPWSTLGLCWSCLTTTRRRSSISLLPVVIPMHSFFVMWYAVTVSVLVVMPMPMPDAKCVGTRLQSSSNINTVPSPLPFDIILGPQPLPLVLPTTFTSRSTTESRWVRLHHPSAQSHIVL